MKKLANRYFLTYLLNTMSLSFIMVGSITYIAHTFNMDFCLLWVCGFVLLFSINFIVTSFIKKTVNYVYDRKNT